VQIALGGHAPDDPDDPFWIVPAIVDTQVITGPVTQERLEDLQLFAFLTSLAASGALHPLGVTSPDEDPPDRFVRFLRRDCAPDRGASADRSTGG
jgi:hypothetical protein